MSYQINKINKEIIQILDEYYDCIYVIKGEKKSLVIDLGMDNARIKPVIEYLVNTPYDIICTHGHFDHVGRSGEFDKIYMSLLDKDVYLDNYKIVDINNTKLSFIDDLNIYNVLDKYDLGDRIIHILPCFGHTPGSVIVLDQKNKTIFTGDAIGSGCGVWMQVDYALSIKEYLNSLQECYDILKTYNVDDSWTFLGGHAFQEYQSKVSDYNKFDIRVLTDMIILCKKLINDEIEYRDIRTTEFSTGKPYYASYNKAEMIFTLSQLKSLSQ